MKIIEGKKYYTLGEVSSLIGKTRVTILRWYEYEENNSIKYLPEPIYLNNSKIRYFKEEDLNKFEEFQKNTPRGAMIDTSIKYNGKVNK